MSRLTLETADERKAWLELMAETCSTREADAAIRAYRERLPKVCTLLGDLEPGVAAGIGDAMGGLIDADREERESDGAPRNTGGYHGTHLVLPPGWRLDPTPAGEWRVTDADDPSQAIVGPDAEELANSAWKRWARAEQGPTEGASDAGPFEHRDDDLLRGLAVGYPFQSDDDRSIPDALNRIADTIAELRGRPPTGEASPDADDAGVWEKRSRAYRKCADRFQAERDEVEAKLGTLIGAVESLLVSLDSESEYSATASASASRLRAAVDAAKGDAPTTKTCQPQCDDDAVVRLPDLTYPCPEHAPTADPRPLAPADLEAKVTAAIKQERGPRAPAPQVPDSPGWWWHRDDCMHVSVCQGGPNEGKLVYKYGLADGDGWGGRCTRGAPDGNTSSSDGLGEE